MSLRDVLDEASAGLSGVDVVATAGGAEYRVGGEAFAVFAGEAAEFRLAPAVARAAAATPDAARSPRGPDWVTFRPADLDRYAQDRASAWFQSAFRLAAGIRS